MVRRYLAYVALVLSVGLTAAVGILRDTDVDWPQFGSAPTEAIVLKGLSALAILLAAWGLYALAIGAIEAWSVSKARAHDTRNVIRLAFIVGVTVAILGVVTEQWVGLLVSLGVVGVGVTFALQQPILSLLGWTYITLKRPYQVGDRVKIESAKGDVVEVDFLVTTLWEIDGDLVSSHQPSGRTVTVPNSVILSSEVFNYSTESFPFVWNELAVQVAYETDLAFAREEMALVADDYLGDEMERRIAEYREALAETPVELDVRDRPSVNVTQEETWVELRLRYLADPKRMQVTRNELYERILERFNEHPDRVSFPVGRYR